MVSFFFTSPFLFMIKKNPVQIGVIGKSGNIPKEVELLAEEVGKEIARKKAVLICGGRDGVMKAASRGCSMEGGTVVCILPSLKGDDANEYCTICIPTGMGFARNFLNITSSHVIIMINGSFGTLSEFTYAQIWNVPVVILKDSGGMADYLVQHTPPGAHFSVATTPAEAVKIAIEHATQP